MKEVFAITLLPPWLISIAICEQPASSDNIQIQATAVLTHQTQGNTEKGLDNTFFRGIKLHKELTTLSEIQYE